MESWPDEHSAHEAHPAEPCEVELIHRLALDPELADDVTAPDDPRRHKRLRAMRTGVNVARRRLPASNKRTRCNRAAAFGCRAGLQGPRRGSSRLCTAVLRQGRGPPAHPTASGAPFAHTWKRAQACGPGRLVLQDGGRWQRAPTFVISGCFSSISRYHPTNPPFAAGLRPTRSPAAWPWVRRAGTRFSTAKMLAGRRVRQRNEPGLHR